MEHVEGTELVALHIDKGTRRVHQERIAVDADKHLIDRIALSPCTYLARIGTSITTLEVDDSFRNEIGIVVIAGIGCGICFPAHRRHIIMGIVGTHRHLLHLVHLKGTGFHVSMIRQMAGGCHDDIVPSRSVDGGIA